MRSATPRGFALTRRGWGVVAGAVLLAAAGRVLGVFELFILAVACAGLIVAGVVTVVGRPPTLEASRRLSPPRVHAGVDTRVELAVANRGRRPTPVVTVRDSFQDGRRARFLVAPLRPGREEQASYRLTVERRGRYLLGPLEVSRSDSFGLVASTHAAAPSTVLTVYPAVEKVAPMASSRGGIASDTRLASVVGASGDDFYGLREYQVGDDLRRVHWPSTARLDELIIRQLEMPREGRAAVLLDVRRRSHTEASMEAAVSAAASIIIASSRQGSSVHLFTTSGFDSGSARGASHLESILEHLAVVEPEPGAQGLSGPSERGGQGPSGPSERGGQGPSGPSERGPADRLHDSAEGGALAVVTTNAAGADELAVTARRRGHHDRLVLVVVERSATGDRPAGLASALGAATVVRVSGPGSLAAGWDRAMARLPGRSR